MAFRFRKRIKILPGVHMNIGKRGVSYSIGPRGAKFTFGNGRTRASAGIPGTGLSWSSRSNLQYDEEPAGYWGRPWGPKFLANAIFYAVVYVIAWMIMSGILMSLFFVVDVSLNITEDNAFVGGVVLGIIILMCAAYAIYLYIRRFKRKLMESRSVIQ